MADKGVGTPVTHAAPAVPAGIRAKPQSLHVNLPHARLYIEDLEAINRLLADLGPVAIETDRYHLTSLDDIERLPTPEITELIFRVRDPEITVYLGRKFAAITSSTAPFAVQGAAAQIAERVTQRRDWWDWFEHPWMPYLALVLIFGPAVAVSIGPGSSAGQSGRWAAAAIAMLGVVGLAGFQVVSFMTRQVAIVPQRRSAASSFWSRNRERLIVNIVVAVAAATVGALLTKLF